MYEAMQISFIRLQKASIMSKKTTVLFAILFCATIFSSSFSMQRKSSLQQATLMGDLDTIKKLVEQEGIDVNEICKHTGNTALHSAVFAHAKPGKKKRQSREIIDYLLSKGAAKSVCLEHPDNGTPLHVALNTWHPDTQLLDTLLERGQVDKSFIKKLILYRVKNDPTIVCLLKYLVDQE